MPGHRTREDQFHEGGSVTNVGTQVTLRGLILAAVGLARVSILIATLVILGHPLVVKLPFIGILALFAVLFLAIPLRSKRETAQVWSIYLVGFVLFRNLRALADEAGMPVQYEYLIAIDRFVLGGELPTTVLQGLFYRPGSTDGLTALAMVVYFSFFLSIHIAALYVWFRHQERFRFYVAMILGTAFLSLPVNFLLPSAPPWMAARDGYIPTTVHRIVREVVSG